MAIRLWQAEEPDAVTSLLQQASLKKPFAALYEWADLHLAEVEAAQRSFDKAKTR